jgi:hypothetical protein
MSRRGVPSDSGHAEQRRVAQGGECSPAPDPDGQKDLDDV